MTIELGTPTEKANQFYPPKGLIYKVLKYNMSNISLFLRNLVLRFDV